MIETLRACKREINAYWHGEGFDHRPFIELKKELQHWQNEIPSSKWEVVGKAMCVSPRGLADMAVDIDAYWDPSGSDTTMAILEKRVQEVVDAVNALAGKDVV